MHAQTRACTDARAARRQQLTGARDRHQVGPVPLDHVQTDDVVAVVNHAKRKEHQRIHLMDRAMTCCALMDGTDHAGAAGE